MVFNFLKLIPLNIKHQPFSHFASTTKIQVGMFHTYFLLLLFQKTIKNAIWNNFFTKITGTIFHQLLDFWVVFNKLYRVSLDKAQAGIKIAGRNINILRYADDNTIMAENEELRSLLMKKRRVKKLA